MSLEKGPGKPRQRCGPRRHKSQRILKAMETAVGKLERRRPTLLQSPNEGLTPFTDRLDCVPTALVVQVVECLVLSFEPQIDLDFEGQLQEQYLAANREAASSGRSPMAPSSLKCTELGQELRSVKDANRAAEATVGDKTAICALVTGEASQLCGGRRSGRGAS